MNDQLTTARAADKGGYFTVNITAATGNTLPYIVFAQSDFEAARIVKNETGYMATQHEVEGPYERF